MGYLNNQLEKVASSIADSMEKKALSASALLRIGQKAAVQGPKQVSNLAKRLVQRNNAIDKVMPSRLAALDDAKLMEQRLRKLLGSKQGHTDSYYRVGVDVSKAQRRIPGGKPIEGIGAHNVENAFNAPVAGKLDIDDLANMQYL
jgi:hypothetical protein